MTFRAHRARRAGRAPRRHRAGCDERPGRRHRHDRGHRHRAPRPDLRGRRGACSRRRSTASARRSGGCRGTRSARASVLSRAVAGVHRGRVVAALPGSPKAVVLAVDRVLAPILAHAVALARGRRAWALSALTCSPSTRRARACSRSVRASAPRARRPRRRGGARARGATSSRPNPLPALRPQRHGRLRRGHGATSTGDGPWTLDGGRREQRRARGTGARARHRVPHLHRRRRPAARRRGGHAGARDARGRRRSCFDARPRPRQHIRRAGEDLRAGTPSPSRRGRACRAGALALAAMLGGRRARRWRGVRA